MTGYIGPVVTTDSVLLRNHDGVVDMLIHERPRDPHAGMQAIPGVYIQNGETIAQATRRCLSTKGGVVLDDTAVTRTIAVFDSLDRDPRGHALSVITVTFIPYVADQKVADGASWVPLTADSNAGLAFDHDEIADQVYDFLHANVWVDDFVLRGMLAGRALTTPQIRDAVVALGVTDNTSNIRRSLVNSGLMTPSNETISLGRGKPSVVWRWA